jgi:hypothetical protein
VTRNDDDDDDDNSNNNNNNNNNNNVKVLPAPKNRMKVKKASYILDLGSRWW